METILGRTGGAWLSMPRRSLDNLAAGYETRKGDAIEPAALICIGPAPIGTVHAT
jgi:hypothetical protein